MIERSTTETAPAVHARLAAPASRARALWALVAKELLVEWRQRARLSATAFFGLMVLLMFSFAVGPKHALLVKNAPGYLWLGIFFAGVLHLGAAMRVETTNDALDGLRLAGVSGATLFFAKALVNTLVLAVLGGAMLPICLALYGAQLTGSAMVFVGVLLLGCGAVCAPGTLYGIITARARAQDVLFPLLLLPLVVPSLMAAVKATGLLFTGDPMGQLGSWLQLLAACNGIYWPLSALLFGRVIEE